MRIVLDTNVLVAALRSRRGGSFALLSAVGRGQFAHIVSVPLVMQYESVLMRPGMVPLPAPAVQAFAEREGVSMNQLIASALAEKLAALGAEDYLATRAARGSREQFDAALAQVPDVEPDAGDDIRSSPIGQSQGG